MSGFYLFTGLFAFLLIGCGDTSDQQKEENKLIKQRLEKLEKQYKQSLREQQQLSRQIEMHKATIKQLKKHLSSQSLEKRAPNSALKYTRDPKMLVEMNRQALKIIRHMSGSRSPRDIAEALNKRGLFPKDRKEWDARQVARVIQQHQIQKQKGQ